MFDEIISRNKIDYLLVLFIQGIILGVIQNHLKLVKTFRILRRGMFYKSFKHHQVFFVL